MKVADVVAKILKAEGVDYFFAYPVNHLIEAAAKADIRTIIVRQERVGLHMAEAIGRPFTQAHACCAIKVGGLQAKGGTSCAA